MKTLSPSPSQYSIKVSEDISGRETLPFTEFLKKLPFKAISGFYLYSLVSMLRHPRLILIMPRGFSKSTICYYATIKMLLTGHGNILYFSNTPAQAKHHVKKIKEILEAYSYEYKDLKPRAQTLARIRNSRGGIVEIRPYGIQTSVRGLHAGPEDLLILDDVLADPDKLGDINPLKTQKINNLAKRVISPMLKPGSRCIIVGTLITPRDFLRDENFCISYHVSKRAALENDKSIWPEMYPTKWLENERERIGKHAFSSEYMNAPQSAMDAFIDPTKLITGIKLETEPEDGYRYSIGGDPGKRRHAGFLCVVKERDGKAELVYIKFFYGVDYIEQLNEAERLAEVFNAWEVKLDNTNQVFTTLEEEGRISEGIELVHFTAKLKKQMAAAIDIAITRKALKVPDNQVLIDDLCAVTNDLKAQEWKDTNGHIHHGDAFQGLGLALMGLID